MEAAHARQSNDSRQLADALGFVGRQSRGVLAAMQDDEAP
jgi:hypothetical protein